MPGAYGCLRKSISRKKIVLWQYSVIVAAEELVVRLKFRWPTPVQSSDFFRWVLGLSEDLRNDFASWQWDFSRMCLCPFVQRVLIWMSF
jgi:hypothetical protein